MSLRDVLDPGLRSENAREFEFFLNSKIIGQERAIRRLVQAYEFSLSPLRVKNRPILFALYPGPSGVGKTFMAKCVAEFFFGKDSAFTKIPCADFQQGHEIASLIGSPPGFVGHGVPPRLAQARIDKFAVDNVNSMKVDNTKLRELEDTAKSLEEQYRQAYAQAKDKGAENLHALAADINGIKAQIFRIKRSFLTTTRGELFSVILFDEIEKAHPALHNFLLEVAAEGEASLQTGEKTSMKNSFIFVTSNAGSKRMAKLAMGGTNNIGYGSAKEKDNGNLLYREVMVELKKVFPTEFLGRISDDVVIFNPLEESTLWEIADRQLDYLCFDMQTKVSAELIVSEDIKKMIVGQALEHPEYGARPIGQKIQKLLMNPLASLTASHQIRHGDIIYAELTDNGVVFSSESPAPFPEALEASADL